MRNRRTGFPGRSVCKSVLLISVIVAAGLSLATREEAQAVTIDLHFIDDGEWLPLLFLRAGAAPGNAAGGGNLESILNVAADAWEAAILDDFTVTVNYGWRSRTGGTTASTSSNTDGGNPERVVQATIVFDNDGSTGWFLDSTPTESSEYGTYAETWADLGVGPVNTGRVWSNPAGAAANIDLLTTAMHEIGHALGLDTIVDGFADDSVDGDIDVTAPRPFAGTQIPITSGAHLNLPNGLMKPTASFGKRILPSVADILAIAEASDFEDLELSLPKLTYHSVTGNLTMDTRSAVLIEFVLHSPEGAFTGAAVLPPGFVFGSNTSERITAEFVDPCSGSPLEGIHDFGDQVADGAILWDPVAGRWDLDNWEFTYTIEGVGGLLSGEIEVVSFLPGDVDLDNDVDVWDIRQILAANSFDSGTGGWRWEHGDFNGDGFVDWSDIQMIVDHDQYGRAVGGALADMIPEPASLAILALGAMAVIRRRREG